MNKWFPLSFLALAALLMSGCASSTGSCNSGGPSGWNPVNWWQNRPTPIRDLFRGEPCNTCNPPVGLPTNYGTNFAPGCESGTCGTNVLPGPQSTIQGTAPGVPYYPDSIDGGMGTISPGTYSSGYMPAGSEVGSGVQLNSPIVGSTEIERPPMYGRRDTFN